MMAKCEICDNEADSCDTYDGMVICKRCFFAVSSRFMNREKRIGRRLTDEEKIKIMRSYLSDIGRMDCNVKIKKDGE